MTLPVLLPAHACPTCGAGLVTWSSAQPALVRHGGYGSTTRTIWRTCIACRSTRETAQLQERP